MSHLGTLACGLVTVSLLTVSLAAPTLARAPKKPHAPAGKTAAAQVLACPTLTRAECEPLAGSLADEPGRKALIAELLAALQAGADATASERIAGLLAVHGGAEARCKMLPIATAAPSKPGFIDLLVGEARLGCAKAVKPLLDALGGPGDERTKVLAAGALGLLGDVKALPALIAGLRDRSVRLQRACALAIGMVQTDKPGDTGAGPALIGLLGEAAVYPPARAAALRSLARLKVAAAVPIATQLVSDDKMTVARAALELLAAIPAAWAAPAIAYGLDKEGLRAAAARAAATSKNPDLTAKLLQMARGDVVQGDERTAVLNALAVIKPDGAAGVLVSRLPRAGQQERQQLLQIVARMGDRTVVPDLVRYLPQAQPEVAKFVIYALEKLTGKRLGTNADAWFQHAGLEPDGTRSPR